MRPEAWLVILTVILAVIGDIVIIKSLPKEKRKKPRGVLGVSLFLILFITIQTLSWR